MKGVAEQVQSLVSSPEEASMLHDLETRQQLY